MKLIDRAKAAVMAFRGQEQKSAPGDLTAWASIFRTGLDTWGGFSDSLVKPYAQHPTIYAAVSAIANNLSSIPIEFFPLSDTKRERPDPEALPLQVMESPNPLMVGTQLLEATIVNLELYGNAFWWKGGIARRTGSGPEFPTVIECWDPCRVRPKMNGDRLIGWEYRTQNTTVNASVDRVMHFKYFNPYDPVWGLGPLEPAAVVGNGDYQAAVWNRAFFDNHAVPYGLLTPKSSSMIDKDAMTRLRDQMEARHRGAGNHGKLGAVNIPMEFLEIGASQKDMDFPSLLDHATEKILMVWKVPPVVAGVLKDANYNVSIQQAKQFWHNHMSKLHYFEAVIYHGLCVPYGIKLKPYFKVETIRALTEDMEALSNTMRNFWNMGATFEMLNERFETGFDTSGHQSLDTTWVPFSLVNADDQAAMGVQTGPQRAPRQGEGQNQPGDESTVANDPTQGKALPSSQELYRRLNWKTVISAVRDEESAMERVLRAHFFRLKVETLQRLKGTNKAFKAPSDGLNVEIVLFDEDKSAKELEVRLEPIVKSSVHKGIQSIAAVIATEFDYLSPGVVKFLAEKMFEIADLVDGPAIERLRAALLEGVGLGESIDKIADRVEEAFAVERSRAERIARTEVAESFNAGRFDAMKQAGITRHEWLTARDNRVRDTHEVLDGDVVVIGDRFANGLLYPTDPNGPPEEVVNCRCVALPA